MKEDKIVIDLKEFENKSVLEFKQAVAEKLRSVMLYYSVPSPNQKGKTIDYQPFDSWDFSDSRNDYVIKEIKLK